LSFLLPIVLQIAIERFARGSWPKALGYFTFCDNTYTPPTLPYIFN
jgi:hypothetical protein